jgi:hypothetical protein
VDEWKGEVTVTGLSNNPTNCDCGVRALRQWLPGAGMSGICCVSPEKLKGQILVEVADDQLICHLNHLPTTTPSTTATSSSRAMTEPDIIWSVPLTRDKPLSSSKCGTGTANKAVPAAGSSSLNNDDTLIISIVCHVIAFKAVLIIVTCIIRV